jgi:hypothetical protein
MHLDVATVTVAIGASLGAIVAETIRLVSHRGSGAGAVVEAANDLVDRLLKRNTALAKETRDTRAIVVELLATIDDVLDASRDNGLDTKLPDQLYHRLAAMNNKARGMLDSREM